MKRTKALTELIRAARVAAEWMCEADEGTDQHERGIALMNAVETIDPTPKED